MKLLSHENPDKWSIALCLEPNVWCFGFMFNTYVLANKKSRAWGLRAQVSVLRRLYVYRQKTMTIDLLFLSKNRLCFTRHALEQLRKNTNWALVRRVLLVDDRSTDGTDEYVQKWAHDAPVRSLFFSAMHGSPAGVMNWYIDRNGPCSEVLCKIDNDVIVPFGWLDQCAAVMEAHPELDLLGIEPPASRVPHFSGGKRNPQPEVDGAIVWSPSPKRLVPGHSTPSGYTLLDKVGYAPCDSIGGIGLMRTKCFTARPPIRPYNTHGGFTDWQIQHCDLRIGWVVPPLKLFLLDRLPFEPFLRLGAEYEAKGWQRAWSHYDPKDHEALWGWWAGEKGDGR